jgi:hypothetical protein
LKDFRRIANRYDKLARRRSHYIVAWRGQDIGPTARVAVTGYCNWLKSLPPVTRKEDLHEFDKSFIRATKHWILRGLAGWRPILNRALKQPHDARRKIENSFADNV